MFVKTKTQNATKKNFMDASIILGIALLLTSFTIVCVFAYLVYKYKFMNNTSGRTIVASLVLFQIAAILASVYLINVNIPSEPSCALDSLPNIYIFKPGDDLNTQAVLNSINYMQKGTDTGGTYAGQWSTNRYALLFLPGTYNVTFQIPYYVSVIGCGKNPDAVAFNGGPVVYNSVDGSNEKHNGLNNFWRSCENVKVTNQQTSYVPPQGMDVPPPGMGKLVGMTWAVSQAAPLRKVHVAGNLTLFDITQGDPNPMTSGGFAANCKIDGTLWPGSQQQFLFRNCDLEAGTTKSGVWNTVYLGCKNPPAATCPLDNLQKDYIGVNVEKTLKIREKPNLSFIDGKFKVLVYRVNKDIVGAQWEDPQIILDVCNDFYVATPSSKAKDINSSINKGKHVLFTPGIYSQLGGSIRVNRAGTILLGIGFPTLVSNSSDPTCISVGDVEDVTIAGILIQSGKNTDVLCKFGDTAKNAQSGYIYDFFVRVGGPDTAPTNANVMLEINSSGVVCDNLWLWRADHGIDHNFIGWDKNTCKNALVVNGDNVTIYGLAAEHTQSDIVLWNGNNGYNVFYQSELPYDVPNDTSIIKKYQDDVVSYRVTGTGHQAFGSGAYSYFNVAPVVAQNGFVVPANTKMTNTFTVFLAGPNSQGGIAHVVNNLGSAISQNPDDPQKSVLSYVCKLPV